MSNTKFIDGPYAAAKYSKKRVGIGKNGEGAFCFITPRQGDDFDDDILYSVQLMKCSPELYQQLEESNDCMLALVDTLAKYGHNTHDLLEQVKRNEFVLAKARGE